MEIVSYLKGKKAQKQIKEMQEVIGQDVAVIGTYADADERIGELERKNKDRVLSTKIEEITKNTAIQLNKNALRMSASMNANKFNHINLIYDGLNDDSSIDYSNSVNIAYNKINSTVGRGSGSEDTVFQLAKIETDEPVNVLTISLAVSDSTKNSITVLAANGENDFQEVQVDELNQLLVAKQTGLTVKMLLSDSNQVEAISTSWK